MAYQELRGGSPAGRRSAHWWDWINVAAGIWLFVSPWVLNFYGAAAGSPVTTAIAMTAAWNAWVLGAVVFLFSLAATHRPQSRPEWVNMLLGVWIFISPWILGFARLSPALWDHWITGAVIVIVAFVGIAAAWPDRGEPVQ